MTARRSRWGSVNGIGAAAAWPGALLIGHKTIIVVSLCLGIWMIPLLTSLPSFFGQWLRLPCNNTQHTGLADEVADFRLCTRTVILNPLVRFLYRHMNDHIEHPMYPPVPCYNLGRLHRAICHELPDGPRGLIGAWRQIIGIVKRRKSDPAYQFFPKLPAPSGAAPDASAKKPAPGHSRNVPGRSRPNGQVAFGPTPQPLAHKAL